MSARPALEAVICDAGGTLVRLDFDWMCGDLSSHGIRTDPTALRRAEVEGRRAYDATGRRAAPGRPAARGDIHAYFGAMLATAGVPPAMLAPAIERFLARERASGLWCRPMEGAREALDGLRAMGLRLAVVSNSDGRAEQHLSHAGMMAGIEFVVDSHRVGVEKPDPGIFALALGRLGTRADRTLYVGDIRSVDEVGARSAGLGFVLLDPFGDYGAPGTPRITGMEELAGWIAGRFTVAGAPGSTATGKMAAGPAATRTPAPGAGAGGEAG